MKSLKVRLAWGGRRALLAAAISLMALALLSFSNAGRAQESGRPRRTNTTTTPQQTPTPRATPRPTPGTSVGPVRPGTVILNETPPDMADPVGQVIDEGGTVVVDTELVNLNVRVIDRSNHPIGDVRQNEFHVFENGVEQPIAFFSREEVPISYGLAIDNSNSMRSQIEKVIEAGKIIIDSNKPGDETFLVRFIDSDKIEQITDFTPRKDDLVEAIDNLYTEGGQTAVVDAVYVSAEHVAQYKKGDDRRRRALIVVTDGEDRGSQYKPEELFERLREEDVQIYVIGFVNELDKEGGIIRKSPREKAVNLINRMAKETGGRAFFPQSLGELSQIAAEIVRDMRTQYVVGYYPTNKAKDGSYRSIRIAVEDAAGKDKRIALTRSGRVAGREGGAPTPKLPVTRSTNPAPAQKPASRNP